MLDHISPDLMRACAKFTPSGLPKNIDRENLRRFRRSVKSDTVPTDASVKSNSFFFKLGAVLASLQLSIIGT